MIMNFMQKVLFILGVTYAAIGVVVTAILLGIPVLTGDFVYLAAIPLFFVVLGLSFLTGVGASMHKRKVIMQKGIKYPAKIYSYVQNTAYTVNDHFPYNAKVHYFDRNHIERETIIPTAFKSGAAMYPIGMTIDIYEYRGKYAYDPDSIRNEILPNEEELMDDKPIDALKVRLVAVKCKTCGASYQDAAGYTGKCPYCGSYQNVTD